MNCTISTFQTFLQSPALIIDLAACAGAGYGSAHNISIAKAMRFAKHVVFNCIIEIALADAWQQKKTVKNKHLGFT